jgi:hypothetical protein
MRIYLLGDGPAVQALKQLLQTSGHELTTNLADAEALLVCPPATDRDETSKELVKLAAMLPGPILISLVSFEPNLHWPANFCHACDGTLRGHVAFRCLTTRTHFRTSFPERTSDLLLGADTDVLKAALLAVWQPCSDGSTPLTVEMVDPTEEAAAKVLTP